MLVQYFKRKGNYDEEQVSSLSDTVTPRALLPQFAKFEKDYESKGYLSMGGGK